MRILTTFLIVAIAIYRASSSANSRTGRKSCWVCVWQCFAASPGKHTTHNCSAPTQTNVDGLSNYLTVVHLFICLPGWHLSCLHLHLELFPYFAFTCVLLRLLMYSTDWPLYVNEAIQSFVNRRVNCPVSTYVWIYVPMRNALSHRRPWMFPLLLSHTLRPSARSTCMLPSPLSLSLSPSALCRHVECSTGVLAANSSWLVCCLNFSSLTLAFGCAQIPDVSGASHDGARALPNCELAQMTKSCRQRR